MRLIVDRQAMIDQTLSGYGSLATTCTPRSTWLRQRPAPARAGHRRRPSRCSRRPARTGSRSSFTGDGIGSVAVPAANLFAEQAKAAGIEVKVTKKSRVLRRRLPVLPVRPGLLEHPQLHPAGRRRHVPRSMGGTYNETHWDNEQHRDLVNPPRVLTGQAGRPAPPGPGDRVQRGRPDHLGLPPAGRRLRGRCAGDRAERLPAARATTSSIKVSV